MTADEFRAWRDRLKMSLSEAAYVLARGRSTICAYQAGTLAVPESVERLCGLLEADKRFLARLRRNFLRTHPRAK